MGWVIKTTPRPINPRERPGTHCCIGGCLGPQARSARVQKISHSPGFDPLTVQPVASRYIEYAIPPTNILTISKIPVLYIRAT